MPRILLAEDNDAVGDMLQAVLERDGFEAVAVANAGEPLSRTATRQTRYGIPSLRIRLSMMRASASKAERQRYPRTLIFEKDKTARPEVGRPIDIAGRKVVKISIRFTCGRSCSESFESERMR